MDSKLESDIRRVVRDEMKRIGKSPIKRYQDYMDETLRLLDEKPGRMLHAQEVARVLGVSVQRVYTLARNGVLPATRMGRQIRIDSNVLEQWVKHGGQAYLGGWRKEPHA
ncbi:helix-turn-helix domain-containing protein [Alicyclobacillus fastidiosus]|uniref:Helix-turn-helix domain-containing protein n=1 Tax=Alicyclobacillus fastidiosus TaxID=392011 RepID=A0ABV5AN06_9BACL